MEDMEEVEAATVAVMEAEALEAAVRTIPQKGKEHEPEKEKQKKGSVDRMPHHHLQVDSMIEKDHHRGTLGGARAVTSVLPHCLDPVEIFSAEETLRDHRTIPHLEGTEVRVRLRREDMGAMEASVRPLLGAIPATAPRMVVEQATLPHRRLDPCHHLSVQAPDSESSETVPHGTRSEGSNDRRLHLTENLVSQDTLEKGEISREVVAALDPLLQGVVSSREAPAAALEVAQTDHGTTEAASGKPILSFNLFGFEYGFK